MPTQVHDGSRTTARLPRYGDRRRMRIGILGGSFNPAHAGHLHIARTALRKLRLHQVWLLVSPQNPLKDAATLASLTARLASAAGIADGRRIVATDIERYLNTRYTCDTLRVLRTRFPRVRFVWLMGADNLTQFPRWRDWVGIAHTTPFAVLPRPTYTLSALAGQAARRFAHARRGAAGAIALPGATPPAWVFLGGRENSLSATALRRQGLTPPGDRESPANPQPHRTR